ASRPALGPRPRNRRDSAHPRPESAGGMLRGSRAGAANTPGAAVRSRPRRERRRFRATGRGSTSSLGSPVLSRTTSLGALAGIFRFHFAPELVMRNATPFAKAPAGGVQNRLHFRGVAHEQALHVRLAFGP